MNEMDYKELIEETFNEAEQTPLVLLIASLISSDTCCCAENCEKSLEILMPLREALADCEPKTEVMQKNKAYFLETLDSGISTVERDLENYKKDDKRRGASACGQMVSIVQDLPRLRRHQEGLETQ